MNTRKLDLNDILEPAIENNDVLQFGNLQIIIDGLLGDLTDQQQNKIRELQAQGVTAQQIFAELLVMNDRLDTITIAYYDAINQAAKTFINDLTSNIFHREMGYGSKYGKGTQVLHGLQQNWMEGPKHQLPLQIVAQSYGDRTQPGYHVQGGAIIKEGAAANHLSLVDNNRPVATIVVNGELTEDTQTQITQFSKLVAERVNILHTTSSLGKAEEIVTNAVAQYTDKPVTQDVSFKDLGISVFKLRRILNQIGTEVNSAFNDGSEIDLIEGTVNELVNVVATKLRSRSSSPISEGDSFGDLVVAMESRKSGNIPQVRQPKPSNMDNLISIAVPTIGLILGQNEHVAPIRKLFRAKMGESFSVENISNELKISLPLVTFAIQQLLSAGEIFEGSDGLYYMSSESSSSTVSDQGHETRNPDVGGINLNPALMDLQIKRDGKGVPLPFNLQPIEIMNINGLIPVIINVTPVLNVPLLLGFADSERDDTNAAYNTLLGPMEPRKQHKAVEPELVSFL